MIKEARYKYLPDNVVMAQLFGKRGDELNSRVSLYEVPQPQSEEAAE